MADLKMSGLIEHLTKMIASQFHNDVSQIYYGDVGVYPPKAFQNARGEQRAAIALVPKDRDPDEGSRTAAGEERDLLVYIMVMVNMTPYFEAMPTQAPGERILVELTDKISEWFEQDANFDLGGRITSSRVGKISYEWMQRGNLAIRTAVIEYVAKVHVSRQQI